MQNIIIVIFIIGYIIFVYKTRKGNNYSNYAVAGRTVGSLLLFLSMCALFTGPGWTLGLTQQGYSTGYFAFFIASFYGLGKIFEGNVIAPRLREKFSDAYSIGEVVGGKDSHNHQFVQIFTGIISIGLLIGFSTIMAKSGGEILNNFLDIDKTLGVIFISGIVTIYSVFGGLKSSMLTDAFQFIFIFTLVIILFVTILLNGSAEFGTFINTARDLTSRELQNNTFLQIFGLAFTWFFGEMLVPPTINGILGSKSSKVAKKAITFSGITMIFWLFLMLTIGILSNDHLSLNSNSDQILLETSKMFLNPAFYTLFALALIGVVMSTQDSLINSASITFGKDILRPFNLDEKNTYLYSRIFCIVVGVLSIIFSTYLPNIIDSLLLFYSIWVPSMLVPLLFSIFKKKLNWQSAVSSMFVGVVFGLFWGKFNFLTEIPTILIGLIASLITYLFSDNIIRYLKK